MKRFEVLVYGGDPGKGARPCQKRMVIAESQGHASKLVMDELNHEKFAWVALDARDWRGCL
jgi:hypothetical protein